MTGVRPVLEQRADGPKDEVPSRLGLVKQPPNWFQARSGVLFKDVLVGRCPDRSDHKGNQGTQPPTHALLSESRGKA